MHVGKCVRKMGCFHLGIKSDELCTYMIKIVLYALFKFN